MKKTILIGILILFTVSCAPLMEETWTVTTLEGPVTVRHYDPARELLFGFYCASLINLPKTHNNLLFSSYYYPLIIPPYRAYSGPNGLPTWEDVIYEQRVDSSMRDYEYKVQSIKDDLIYDLRREMERVKDDIADDLEDAKDELESKKEDADDAADELERAAYDAKIRLKNAANDADFERLVAENATTKTRVLSDNGSEKSTGFDFSFLDDGRLPSEDQVEVIQWFGPSAGKKFVLVSIDYAKRARPFGFSLETSMSGEVVLYGTRWPPKDPINWREEKEASRIVKNGLANAIKEIIDELGER